MRPEEIKYWDQIDTRHEEAFGRYKVKGTKYKCTADDEIAWYVESHKTGELPHFYWFADEDFHSTATKPFKNTRLISIFERPVTEDIDPAEKDAVLQALKKWSGPEQVATTVVTSEQSGPK
jgi:hypothetical protein